MQIFVEQLTEKAFAEFGRVLSKPAECQPSVTSAISASWLGTSDLMGIGAQPAKQVTFLEIYARPKQFDTVERHVSSAEAFIPLEGFSILLVAPPEATDELDRPDMRRARAFIFDGSRGILMRPGTWHALPYTLTPRCSILVLVDDRILPNNDLHISPVEPIQFVFAGDLAE